MSKLSKLAENIIGSEIIKIAAEVNEKIKNGQKVYNLTIGDFDPKIFPIPSELKSFIVEEVMNDQTNYPPADGVLELRQSISNLLKKRLEINYSQDEILVAGGARPIIYSIFKTIVDPNDKVIFAVPSWNNNHYTYLNSAQQIIIEGTPENNFMPSAEDIKPHVKEATLIALCSPQNPTGTTFTKEGLSEICQLIIKENEIRSKENKKPIYLMYDQIYWELTFGDTIHYNPVQLLPEMKKWTVFVDGISKSLSATGIRVGWSFGPKEIISKMKSILSHVGAWAPKAEQIATYKYLSNLEVYDKFLQEQREKISHRLFSLYKGFKSLKERGLKIDVIKPQAAIYLTVQFDIVGMQTKEGKKLENISDVTKYLLDTGGVAIVPFFAFGTDTESTWFRISVGTCKKEEIEDIINSVKSCLENLK